MTLPTYEVFAIKYAQRDARRTNHFLGGDPHDAPMPMDYFVWLIRNAQRTFVVDTGFNEAMARQRKRTFLRTPSDGLALLGVKAAAVRPDTVMPTWPSVPQAAATPVRRAGSNQGRFFQRVSNCRRMVSVSWVECSGASADHVRSL